MNSDDLRKFASISCEERVAPMLIEAKQCIISSITKQIEDIEKQVEEIQDWFNRMPATTSSMNRLTISMQKLRRLRSEKAKMQKLMKGKLVLNNTTTKRMRCVENTLRSTNTKLEKMHGYRRRLERGNAEVKAGIEACKQTASKSNTACLQVAEREKKMSQMISALEKQMANLQLEVSKDEEKTLELETMLAGINLRCEKAKAKFVEKINAARDTRALVIRGQLLMEAIEAGIKRKREEVSLKMEIDFQRRKDVAQKLEREILKVKAAARATK